MKSDKRFTSSIQAVSNNTLSSQQRIEKSPHRRLYRSANPIRRASAVSFEIGTINEDQCLTTRTYDSFRRMSAPELPPIIDTRKYSNVQNMGNGNREYFKSRSNRLSNNSDSSQKGARIRQSPLSASSSSSHTHGNSGNIPRSKTWVTPDQTVTTEPIPEGLKLDAITNRNGVTVQTPRSGKNGFRTTRLSSKDNSISSGNNNTKPGKSKFYHCASEPKIQPIESFIGAKIKPTMKRNSSDNKLGQNKKLISVEKTQPLTQYKYNSGNVNGMRRYSSTVQLNSIPKNKSETDDYDDDDTDSESGKDQMIIEWLIGVQNEEVEVPPEPCIEYTETPVQTDTAIHIVYSES